MTLNSTQLNRVTVYSGGWWRTLLSMRGSLKNFAA